MLQNAYLVAKIGADTAENERKFAKNLATTLPLRSDPTPAAEVRGHAPGPPGRRPLPRLGRGALRGPPPRGRRRGARLRRAGGDAGRVRGRGPIDKIRHADRSENLDLLDHASDMHSTQGWKELCRPADARCV